MTAKEKICAIGACLEEMVKIGKTPPTGGTLQESLVMLKLAMLGKAMAQVLVDHLGTPQGGEHDTVTE